MFFTFAITLVALPCRNGLTESASCCLLQMPCFRAGPFLVPCPACICAYPICHRVAACLPPCRCLGSNWLQAGVEVSLRSSKAHAALTGVTVQAFGDKFVHGSGVGPPPYVEPYDLLQQPTVDPYYPLQ